MYCPKAPLWPMATALSAAISMSSLATAAPDPGDFTGGGVVPPIEPMTWRSFSLGSNIADFYVADSSESIQDAIDAAQDWDIIELGNDDWDERLNFQGKAIWLISFESARLHGGSYHTSTFEQEGTDTAAAALRITGIEFKGSGYKAQALFVAHTNLEVQNCSFTGWNSVDTNRKPGAAIKAIDSTVTVTGSAFEDCEASSAGALSAYRSTLTVSTSRFHECTATSGGAIESRLSSIILHQCRFSWCTAETGGAVYAHSSTRVSVSECRFENNAAWATTNDGMGGAIYHAGAGDLSVNDSIFENNQADWAAVIYAGTLHLTRARLTNNTTTSVGWIIESASSTTLLDTRFCGNTSASQSTGTDGRDRVFANGQYYDVEDTWLSQDASSGCERDLDLDGEVGISELLFMLEDWGRISVLQGSDADLLVTATDMVDLLANWGSCTPPITDPGGSGGSGGGFAIPPF